MSEQKAIDYLGKTLFELYKERHPEVSDATRVKQINRDRVMYGFRIIKSPFEHITTLSPIAPTPESIDVLPKDFEQWAESEDGYWYRLAYVKELDTLYAYAYML